MANQNHNNGDYDAARTGLIAGVLAYTIWGLFPIYFKLTASIPPLEILSHRVVWAVPFGGLIILARRQWPDVRRALSRPKTLGLLVLAAVLIAMNWGIYIWAIQHDHIFQASLGYYINPLIYVLIGVMFLGETLRKLQSFAVLLAATGVAILTILGGQFPWISLVLALSFTAYGVIRKQVDVGAMPGLFIETLVLFTPAALYLLWLQSRGALAFMHTNADLNILLMLAGPITVLPLLAFAFAAKKLKLSTIGFLQFIGPTLQFMTGVYYGETLSAAHLLCFIFIWSAVGIFIFDALTASRKRSLPKNKA